MPCMCGDALCPNCNPGAAEAEAFAQELYDLLSDMPSALDADWFVTYLTSKWEQITVIVERQIDNRRTPLPDFSYEDLPARDEVDRALANSESGPFLNGPAGD